VRNSGVTSTVATVDTGTRPNVISVAPELSVEDRLRQIQLEVFAVARQYLPEFAQPIIVGLMNTAHSADILVDRVIEFLDSLRINPPQEFMDVLRRYQRATRPIGDVAEVEVIQDQDGVGGVVHHPSPVRFDPNKIESEFTKTHQPFRRRDPRAGRVQPSIKDIF